MNYKSLSGTNFELLTSVAAYQHTIALFLSFSDKNAGVEILVNSQTEKNFPVLETSKFVKKEMV